MILGFPDQFVPVCRYLVRDGEPTRVKWLNDNLLAERGAVYARIYRGIPVCIGSAQGKLLGRLKTHLRGTRSKLGRRYWEWAEGKQVSIVAYKPVPIEILGCKVEVYRGSEATLINEFKPEFVERI
ncbi:MAG: hypothetical protein EXR07_19875 [Acetobacteraceae bacterium]|nr:hypothetical protein [Acetobacteraceae bacterium]